MAVACCIPNKQRNRKISLAKGTTTNYFFSAKAWMMFGNFSHFSYCIVWHSSGISLCSCLQELLNKPFIQSTHFFSHSAVHARGYLVMRLWLFHWTRIIHFLHYLTMAVNSQPWDNSICLTNMACRTACMLQLKQRIWFL